MRKTCTAVVALTLFVAGSGRIGVQSLERASERPSTSYRLERGIWSPPRSFRISRAKSSWNDDAMLVPVIDKFEQSGADRLKADGCGLRYQRSSRSSAISDSRSLPNVTFRLPTEELETQFVKEATAAGLDGLKGHRSVGGMRASIYNAFLETGVEALVDLHRGIRAHPRIGQFTIDNCSVFDPARGYLRVDKEMSHVKAGEVRSC